MQCYQRKCLTLVQVGFWTAGKVWEGLPAAIGETRLKIESEGIPMECIDTKEKI